MARTPRVNPRSSPRSSVPRGRSGSARKLNSNTTSNARRLDAKGRSLDKSASRPSYKGPSTSRGRQRQAITRAY